MADPITVTDLENATLDVTTIGEVAMVGTDADTTTNREGKTLDTLQGRINKIGYEPPVAYGAGITFQDAQDSAKTIEQSGAIYGCIPSARPFTTTGNFAADSVNFFTVQDQLGSNGNVRNDTNNTYSNGTTQAFDLATANQINATSMQVNSKDVGTSVNRGLAENKLIKFFCTTGCQYVSVTKNSTIGNFDELSFNVEANKYYKVRFVGGSTNISLDNALTFILDNGNNYSRFIKSEYNESSTSTQDGYSLFSDISNSELISVPLIDLIPTLPSFEVVIIFKASSTKTMVGSLRHDTDNDFSLAVQEYSVIELDSSLFEEVSSFTAT